MRTRTGNLYKYKENNCINDNKKVCEITELFKGVKNAGITTIAGVDGIGKSTLLKSLILEQAQTKKILYLSAEDYLDRNIYYLNQIINRTEKFSEEILYNIISIEQPVESLFELNQLVNKSIINEKVDVVYIDAIDVLYKESTGDQKQQFLEYIDKLSTSIGIKFVITTDLQFGLGNKIGKHEPSLSDIGFYIMNQANDRVVLLNRLSYWNLPTDEDGNESFGLINIDIFDQTKTIAKFTLRLKDGFVYE